jgi:glutaredoxin 3
MEEPEVIVYSTPDCKYCGMAKAYLAGKGIKFTEYDVAADQEKAQEMVKKSGQAGVPVIEINGRIIVGFEKGAVDAALAKPKPPKRDEFITNLFYDPFHV